jgi:hypothetical protein
MTHIRPTLIEKSPLAKAYGRLCLLSLGLLLSVDTERACAGASAQEV